MLTALESVNATVLSPLCVCLLIFAGISFTLRLRFLQFSGPKKLFSMIRGTKKESIGSSFRALTVALGGTLGVGNISGVALAIACGGPGAVFWMWVSAFFAMIVKYAETVLALFYRERENGVFHGGPMYYIKKGLGNTPVSLFLSAVFSLLCLLSSVGTGSIVQSGAVSEAFYECFHLPGYLCGIILALLCIPALFGNRKKRISDITLSLVPAMTVAFVVLSFTVIIRHAGELPFVFSMILNDAFTPSAAGGGIVGVLCGKGVRYGVTRGLFSNEAGCGSSTIAHATADTPSPEAQGAWGIIEVFVDTVLLCTLTAFVILLSYKGPPDEKLGGIKLVFDAYGSTFGNGARVTLAFSVFLFAYATIICWAFYGCECLRFFTKRECVKNGYLILYLSSVVFGAILPSSLIWEMADLFIYLLLFVNTVCVCFQADAVVRLSPHAFIRKKKATGKAAASPSSLPLPKEQR